LFNEGNECTKCELKDEITNSFWLKIIRVFLNDF
jgi:hypothetical protein